MRASVNVTDVIVGFNRRTAAVGIWVETSGTRVGTLVRNDGNLQPMKMSAALACLFHGCCLARRRMSSSHSFRPLTDPLVMIHLLFVFCVDHVYAYVYVYVYAYLCVYMHMYMYMYMYVYMYNTYRCIHVYIYTHICTCVCTCR